MRRIQSGKKAKNNGELFEKILEHTTRFQDFHLIKIPEGGKFRKINGKPVITPMPSPFDFILLAKGGKAVYFDAKVRAKTLPYSDIFRNKTNYRQYQELLHCCLMGNVAGFLVWFHETDQVVFFEVGVVTDMEPRKSLSAEDGIILGTYPQIDLSILFDVDKG